MRIVVSRRGIRLLHGRHVVSALPATPGPTSSVFDVLAAAVAVFPPAGAPVALLGFAAGGVVAPIRALGVRAPIRAVDLDTSVEPHFRRVAGAWAGEVTLDRAEAGAWLARRRGRFGAIIEDLSLQVPGDVTKPPASIDRLPALLARRLAPGGVAVVNLLPVAGLRWSRMIDLVAAPFADAVVVRVRGYENRVLLGFTRPAPRDVRGRLEDALGRLGSPLAGALA